MRYWALISYIMLHSRKFVFRNLGMLIVTVFKYFIVMRADRAWTSSLGGIIIMNYPGIHESFERNIFLFSLQSSLKKYWFGSTSFVSKTILKSLPLYNGNKFKVLLLLLRVNIGKVEMHPTSKCICCVSVPGPSKSDRKWSIVIKFLHGMWKQDTYVTLYVFI